MINITPSKKKFTQIYLVTNCYGDPNKIYIGKERSHKILSREYNHKRTFGNQIIFTYIDKIDSWDYKLWGPLEKYWIEQFRQWGFNLQNGNKGGGGLSILSEEHKGKISKNNIGKNIKNVLQYDLEGNFIREWSSINQIEKELNIQSSLIVSCLKYRSQTSYNYIWRYKEDPLRDNFSIK